MRLVRYISTRGEDPGLGFLDAMLAGLARDGGLYVPQSWPTVPASVLAGWGGRPYAHVAAEILRAFLGPDLTAAELARITQEAALPFRHPASPVQDRKTSVVSRQNRNRKRRNHNPKLRPGSEISAN